MLTSGPGVYFALFIVLWTCKYRIIYPYFFLIIILFHESVALNLNTHVDALLSIKNYTLLDKTTASNSCYFEAVKKKK